MRLWNHEISRFKKAVSDAVRFLLGLHIRSTATKKSRVVQLAAYACTHWFLHLAATVEALVQEHIFYDSAKPSKTVGYSIETISIALCLYGYGS